MSDLSEIKSLQDRIARIEQTMKEIQESIGAEPKGSGWWGDGESSEEKATELALSDQEQQLVRTGKKIEAIKAYHERTGQGLKEAKDAIDAFDAEG